MTSYIYFFKDGNEFKHAKEGPTESDCQAFQDGDLRVVRVRNYVDSDTKKQVAEVDELAGHTAAGPIWCGVAEAELLMTHGQEWHE